MTVGEKKEREMQNEKSLEKISQRGKKGELRERVVPLCGGFVRQASKPMENTKYTRSRHFQSRRTERPKIWKKVNQKALQAKGRDGGEVGEKKKRRTDWRGPARTFRISHRGWSRYKGGFGL